MPSLKFIQVGDQPMKRVSVVTDAPLSGDWFQNLNLAEQRLIRDAMADAKEQAEEWRRWSSFPSPSFRSAVNMFGTTIECIWQWEESS